MTQETEIMAQAPALHELPLVGSYGGKPKRFVIEYDDMSSRCIGNADGSVDNITNNLQASARLGKGVPEHEKLIKSLRINAGMIRMGEGIAWGSETELMYQAADALEALQGQDLSAPAKPVELVDTELAALAVEAFNKAEKPENHIGLCAGYRIAQAILARYNVTLKEEV